MNNILKNLLIFIVILALAGLNHLYAQQEQATTVTSKVLDEAGEPLPDITVKSFNLKNKVLTDINGEFFIEITVTEQDRLIVSEQGYDLNVLTIMPGEAVPEEIILVKSRHVDPGNKVALPYATLKGANTVGAVSVISGEELESYPCDNILEALAGRIPGLTITQNDYMPGQELVYASVRGVGASVYIDGITRDVTGLSASEIDKIEVFKDLSGRTALGLSGAGPVIWITTKAGEPFNRKVTASVEYGFRNPASLPSYLNAYDYATLYNEALTNDGLSIQYTQEELNAYNNHSDPDHYPDIDYYDHYLRNVAPFARGNINFQGGDDRVRYFSSFTYLSTEGLESLGEAINNDRYKIHGNVDIRLNDFMKLGVNISGSYNAQRFPNEGDGAGVYNIFNTISSYPANAHPIYYGDKLIISDDYPSNITNELMYSGYAEGQILNTQNSAVFSIDLGRIIEGLSLDTRASFDIMNNVIQNKGGTAALYRLESYGSGDTAILIVPEENDVTVFVGNNYMTRRTEGMTSLNYNREAGNHLLSVNAVYYMGLQEERVSDEDYQPDKLQDIALRANYSYAGKYVLQADLSYTGSMRMPEGERFSLFPAIGAAWILSNENFLNGNNMIDYLKLHTSFGIMGVGNYSLNGYNPYYLYKTLWSYVDTWTPGIPGNYGSDVNIYNILQKESTDFKLPKKRYFSAGLQGQLLGKSVQFELSYFNEYNYDKISNRAYTIPSIIGTEFLPATNYGEDVRWGLDGMIQYSGKTGDFGYSAGINAMYLRGKYLIVDESAALEDYRKRAGKDMDLYWLYNDEGLYQSDTEISSRGVTQSWGDVQAGDIRYEDKNTDGLVDERDIYAPGAHAPRVHYGANISLSYKGIRLFVSGQGVADGEVLLSSPNYFQISGTNQSYSGLMLDRYPLTNDYPRLTTVSQNNAQSSTYWLRSAAYFKIKNAELSYRIPASVSHRLFMTDFRIFIRATNLFTFSGLKEYDVDPENIYAGITGYPVFKTYTAGLSLSF